MNAADNAAPVVDDPDLPGGRTVLATIDDTGIAWVYFNRPEKRNAMNPALNVEMYEVLDPLVSCDIAIAAEDAVFGISEVNWGVTPGNLVTRALAEVMPTRDAMFYIMTGESFDGRKAAELRLVTEAVPKEQLRARVTEIAGKLTSLSRWVVHGAKMGFRHSRLVSWEAVEDFLYAKHDQAILFDEAARTEGIKGFLDDKSYRPGLGTYDH